MKEQILSHLIPVFEEYERQNISKIEEAFSISMSRAERRAWKRKLSKSNLKSSVSKSNKMVIELMKEVKDSLVLVKGMCIGADEHFMAYMDLNIQRCAQAIKELEG